MSCVLQHLIIDLLCRCCGGRPHMLWTGDWAVVADSPGLTSQCGAPCFSGPGGHPCSVQCPVVGLGWPPQVLKGGCTHCGWVQSLPAEGGTMRCFQGQAAANCMQCLGP